jgi:hypothetical protein
MIGVKMNPIKSRFCSGRVLLWPLFTFVLALSATLAPGRVIANQIIQTENFALFGSGAVGSGTTSIDQSDVPSFDFFTGSLGDLTGVNVRLDSSHSTTLFAQVVGASIEA